MRRRIAGSRPTGNSFRCAMTSCAAIWNAWLGRGFPEVLDGARMVRQARLAFAGGFFIEAGGVWGGFDQRPPVFAPCPFEIVEDARLYGGGHPGHHGEGLPPWGAVGP